MVSIPIQYKHQWPYCYNQQKLQFIFLFWNPLSTHLTFHFAGMCLSCFKTEGSLALGTRPSKAGRSRAHSGSTEFKLMHCFLTRHKVGKKLWDPQLKGLCKWPHLTYTNITPEKKSSSNRKETDMRNSELKSLKSLPSNSCYFTYLSFSHTWATWLWKASYHSLLQGKRMSQLAEIKTRLL